MSTTAQDIIDAALAKNRKNQPGVTATNTELFNTFLRVFPVFWVVAARVNRTFFGASADVAGSSGAWARPSAAELIFRIENPSGDEVLVVDIAEKDAEPGQPAVYEWGQSFQPAGNASDPDPASDSLTFYYSKKPDTPADADTALDSLWPESFNELLVLELALTLAVKDEREQEIPVLRSDRDAWLARFLAHLEHATVGVVSAGDHASYRRQSVIPLSALLAGGTSVTMG